MPRALLIHAQVTLLDLESNSKPRVFVGRCDNDPILSSALHYRSSIQYAIPFTYLCPSLFVPISYNGSATLRCLVMYLRFNPVRAIYLFMIMIMVALSGGVGLSILTHSVATGVSVFAAALALMAVIQGFFAWLQDREQL